MKKKSEKSLIEKKITQKKYKMLLNLQKNVFYVVRINLLQVVVMFK